MRHRVELYGRLRDAAPAPSIELELADSATARQALAALRAALGEKAALLDGAVLATETAVLAARERVPAEGRLAALPPVCGG